MWPIGARILSVVVALLIHCFGTARGDEQEKTKKAPPPAQAPKQAPEQKAAPPIKAGSAAQAAQPAAGAL